jgi:hypothetical protein
MSGPPFPPEVWLRIFGFLDWKSLQEKAVLVCNSWLEMIRGSPKLSGELSLRSDQIIKDDLIAILSRWMELKVLNAVNGDNFDFEGIKFQDYPNIRKIVVLKQLSGENFNGFPTKSPNWFYTSKVCLDPQITPELVNSLQSLEESKILSPDLVQELTLHLTSKGMYKLLTDLSSG